MTILLALVLLAALWTLAIGLIVIPCRTCGRAIIKPAQTNCNRCVKKGEPLF